MSGNKAPKKTELDRLNDLINWYEKFKPEAGKRIPVAASRETLAKWFGYPQHKKPPNEFEYRGRIIYPAAQATSEGGK
jgi:hypothetical protein